MKKKIAFIIFSFLILICMGYKVGKNAAEKERRISDSIVQSDSL